MRRTLVLVLVNVVVFLALAEIAALALYYAETGRLFYASPPAHPLHEETARGELTGDALHPYFGPIHRPGVRPDTNNIGFGSPHAYPFVRANDRQFLVGIFGGSVARMFCDRGAPRLAARLREAEAFAAREIVPLCFGHEGYKQPQQLIVLAYFLALGQEFDLVLNIDGFNEVALGSYNADRGRDVSMPSPIHLDPLIGLIDRSTMTAAMVESLAAINRHKERMNALAARLRRRQPALAGVVLDRYYAFTSSRYQAELARFAELPPPAPEASLIQVTPPVEERRGHGLYDDIAARWAAASRLMHDLLAPRGAIYLHVLQPNQYYSARVFGEDERRIAWNEATGFKPPVEAGYPALERAAAALRDHVRFADATQIFDREPAPVYEDDCCHYNARGNELLADFIAAHVLDAVAAPPRAPSR